MTSSSNFQVNLWFNINSWDNKQNETNNSLPFGSTEVSVLHWLASLLSNSSSESPSFGLRQKRRSVINFTIGQSKYFNLLLSVPSDEISSDENPDKIPESWISSAVTTIKDEFDSRRLSSEVLSLSPILYHRNSYNMMFTYFSH